MVDRDRVMLDPRRAALVAAAVGFHDLSFSSRGDVVDANHEEVRQEQGEQDHHAQHHPYL